MNLSVIDVIGLIETTRRRRAHTVRNETLSRRRLTDINYLSFSLSVCLSVLYNVVGVSCK